MKTFNITIPSNTADLKALGTVAKNALRDTVSNVHIPRITTKPTEAQIEFERQRIAVFIEAHPDGTFADYMEWREGK